MSENQELIKAKIQAKLEVLKYVRDFIDERINELQTLVSSGDLKGQQVSGNGTFQKEKPTLRQIEYALDLASRTGFKASKTDLERMSKTEVSRLIDQLKEKLQRK